MKINFRAQQPYSQPNSPNNNNNFRIRSLASNDIHSHVDGLAKLATETAKFRAENAKMNRPELVFMCGDGYDGGNEQKNNLIIKIKNFLKPDDVLPGNHEFDSKG